MQHCNTAIYSSDYFCPDCGDEIEKDSIAKSPFDIDPSIFDSVPKFKVNAIFTGVVQRTFYFTVHQLSEGDSGKLNFSYCWLEILDASGQEKKINISAEFKNIDTINVGDTISVCGNFSDKINTPRSNSIDKSIVKNLDFASCVILHNVVRSNVENNALEIPKNFINSFKDLIQVHIALTVGLYFLIFKFTSANSLLLSIPLIYLFVVAPTLHNIIRNRLLYKYKELTNTLLKAAAITPKQLGCENIKRSFTGEDLYCDDCDEPITFGSAYCTRCGHRQSLTAKCELGRDDNEVVHNISMVESKDTIGSRVAQVMSEFTKTARSELITNEYSSGNVEQHTAIYRVVDKKAKANASDTTYKNERTIKTTKRDFDGAYKTNYETVTDETRYRTSQLNGMLFFENIDKQGYCPPSDKGLVELCDLDDMIFVGSYSIDFGDSKPISGDEFYFNVTKNKVIYPSKTLTEKFPFDFKSSWVTKLLFIGSIYGCFKFSSFIPLGVWIALLIGELIYKSITHTSDEKRIEKSISMLYENLDECQKRQPELMKIFAR